MPVQSECIVKHVLGSQTAAAATPGLSSRSPRALPHATSPYSRRSSDSRAVDCELPVNSDDEDDVAEVVALLASARLVPTSSRRPIAAMLCAAGIGSAEALMLAVDRDPSFLSNQVLLRVIAG